MRWKQRDGPFSGIEPFRQGRLGGRSLVALIRASRSVLVVWSENSVTSEWVLEEAETGKRRGILIPVLLDNVEPPFGFGNIQAANLTAWNGDSSSPIFTHLVADITTILGQAPAAVKEAEKRRRSDAEARRRADEEGLREQERQRSEEDARRESQRRIEQEANRAVLLEESGFSPKLSGRLHVYRNDKRSRLLDVQR